MKTTLLLLPGLDGTGIMFTPLLPFLGVEFDVRVQSYPQDPSVKYQHLLELVRSSLPDNDFFILGESFSGPIALRIASEHPKGLRGVILCATFMKNPAYYFPAFLRFLIVAPLFAVWPVSYKLNFMTSFHQTADLLPLMRRVKAHTNNRVLAAHTREAIGVNVERQFQGSLCPMLYLYGKRDIVVPGRNLESMKRLRPDMECHCLDAPHLVLQEAPEEAGRHIRAFMKRNQIGGDRAG